MKMRHIIIVALLLTCCAAAQQARPTELREAGLRMLAQARATAASASPIFRADVLDEIAAAAYEAGEKHAAADTLKEALAAMQEQVSAQPPRTRVSTMKNLGRAANTAWIAADRHLAVHDQSGARAWLGALQELFPGITDERERRNVGSRVYKLQIALGDLEGARQTADAVAGNTDSYALSEIAAQMTANGNVAGATALAEGQPENVAADILKKVAIAQAESRDFAGALKTVQTIQPGFGRVDALAAIGEEESKSGDIASALATFKTALALQPKGSEPSQSVVLAEARSGLFDSALQLISANRNDGYGKSHLYLDVGVIAANAKRPEIAKQCFATAVALIQQEKQPEQQAYAPNGMRTDEKQLNLQDAVFAEAQAGDVADAIDVSKGLSGIYQQNALMAIASAQADAGDVHGADQTLAEDSSRRTPTPMALIEAKAHAGDLTSAINAARPYGGRELEKVFRAYCKPETTARCLSAASDLSFPERRASALLGIAEGLLGVSPPPMPDFHRPFEYPIPAR